MDREALKLFATQIRLETLEMIFHSKASHIGSCFSIVDILAALYGGCMNVNPLFPKDPKRDKVILSKGHAAAALYATLALKGFFPKANLKDFCKSGSSLIGHVSHNITGVEFSTGSLGHGLSVCCGMALAAKNDQKFSRHVVIVSDGELNEGSFWEGVMFAAHHALQSVVIIVDDNQMQSLGHTCDILSLEPKEKKFEAFGFDVSNVDGHDCESIIDAFNKKSSMPKVMIAKTIKGKGVSFMENQLIWHYKNPSFEQYLKAKKELECARDLLTSSL